MEMIMWFEIAFLCGIGVVMGAMAGVSLVGILMEKAAMVYLEKKKKEKMKSGVFQGDEERRFGVEERFEK